MLTNTRNGIYIIVPLNQYEYVQGANKHISSDYNGQFVTDTLVIPAVLPTM